MGVCTLGHTSNPHRTLLLLPRGRARRLWPHTSPRETQGSPHSALGLALRLALPASGAHGGITWGMGQLGALTLMKMALFILSPTHGFRVLRPGFPILPSSLFSQWEQAELFVRDRPALDPAMSSSAPWASLLGMALIQALACLHLLLPSLPFTCSGYLRKRSLRNTWALFP